MWVLFIWRRRCSRHRWQLFRVNVLQVLQGRRGKLGELATSGLAKGLSHWVRLLHRLNVVLLLRHAERLVDDGGVVADEVVGG